MQTDVEFLLATLGDGRAHTLNEILQRSFAERGCGLTVHSRAAELRKKGYDIVNFSVPGARRGYGSAYRLIRSGEPLGTAEPEPGELPSSPPAPTAGSPDDIPGQITIEELLQETS